MVVLASSRGGIVVAVNHFDRGPDLSPLRARIVSIAQGQVGYATDPSDTYCNKFSAYWNAGVDDWVATTTSTRSGAPTSPPGCGSRPARSSSYQLAPGYLNGDSASFYVWGTDHGTWHPVGSGYVPQPGDVAVYGLDTTAVTAVHVAVVVAATGNNAAPDVVNGDGDRTGYSVVEVGDSQAYADVKGKGAPLSGYVSPSPAVGRVDLVLTRRRRLGRRHRRPPRPGWPPWPVTTASNTLAESCSMCRRASSRKAGPDEGDRHHDQERGPVVVVELRGHRGGHQRCGRRAEDDRGQVEGGETGAAHLGRATRPTARPAAPAPRPSRPRGPAAAAGRRARAGCGRATAR